MTGLCLIAAPDALFAVQALGLGGSPAAAITVVFVSPGLAADPALVTAVEACETPIVPVWVSGDWLACAPDDLRYATPYRLPDEAEALLALLARAEAP